MGDEMISRNVKSALGIVFSSKKYISFGIGSFLLFFIFYSFMLPATYTGGRIGLVSLELLDFKLGIFSFIMALLLGLIVPMTAYSFKNKIKASKKQQADSLQAYSLHFFVALQ